MNWKQAVCFCLQRIAAERNPSKLIKRPNPAATSMHEMF